TQTARPGPASLPLSQIVGLLLTLVATLVTPASATGAFMSPFARLALGEKAAVASLLEDPNSPVLASLGSQFPPPLDTIVPGLVLYLMGAALLSFGGFGTYSEWSTFDPVTRTLTGRPVGWEISRYQPGVLAGWDDFKGYYQGRTKVRGGCATSSGWGPAAAGRWWASRWPRGACAGYVAG